MCVYASARECVLCVFTPFHINKVIIVPPLNKDRQLAARLVDAPPTITHTHNWHSHLVLLGGRRPLTVQSV